MIVWPPFIWCFDLATTTITLNDFDESIVVEKNVNV